MLDQSRTHAFHQSTFSYHEWTFRCNLASRKWTAFQLSHCPVGPYRWQMSIGSGNGLVPSGNKPLPDPVLLQIYGLIRPQWVNKPMPEQNGHHFADDIFMHVLEWTLHFKFNVLFSGYHIFLWFFFFYRTTIFQHDAVAFAKTYTYWNRLRYSEWVSPVAIAGATTPVPSRLGKYLDLTWRPGTHRWNLCVFKWVALTWWKIQYQDSSTVETLYSTIYYSKYFIELNFDKSTQYVALWTHKKHPIPRPFGRAMECLLWVLQQKLTVL